MSEILYKAWAIWFVEVCQVSCGWVSWLWSNSAKSHGARWLKKPYWAGYRSALQRGAVQRCSTPRRYGRRRSLISKNNYSSEIFVLTYLVIQEYYQRDQCFASKTCRNLFFQGNALSDRCQCYRVPQAPHNRLFQRSLGKCFNLSSVDVLYWVPKW